METNLYRLNFEGKKKNHCNMLYSTVKVYEKKNKLNLNSTS